MKAIVDVNRCVGHAMCKAYAPEVYQLDELGYNVTGEVEVPPELEEKAEMGARACPELAIRIEASLAASAD